MLVFIIANTLEQVEALTRARRLTPAVEFSEYRSQVLQALCGSQYASECATDVGIRNKIFREHLENFPPITLYQLTTSRGSSRQMVAATHSVDRPGILLFLSNEVWLAQGEGWVEVRDRSHSYDKLWTLEEVAGRPTPPSPPTLMTTLFRPEDAAGPHVLGAAFQQRVAEGRVLGTLVPPDHPADEGVNPWRVCLQVQSIERHYNGAITAQLAPFGPLGRVFRDAIESVEPIHIVPRFSCSDPADEDVAATLIAVDFRPRPLTTAPPRGNHRMNTTDAGTTAETGPVEAPADLFPLIGEFDRGSLIYLTMPHEDIDGEVLDRYVKAIVHRYTLELPIGVSRLPRTLLNGDIYRVRMQIREWRHLCEQQQGLHFVVHGGGLGVAQAEMESDYSFHLHRSQWRGGLIVETGKARRAKPVPDRTFALIFSK